MKITFNLYGLTFVAEADYERLVPARISGPPENCYPAEGGCAEITELTVHGADASFLLESDLAEGLNDAAYEACVEQVERDQESAQEDRAAERAYERRGY